MTYIVVYLLITWLVAEITHNLVKDDVQSYAFRSEFKRETGNHIDEVTPFQYRMALLACGLTWPILFIRIFATLCYRAMQNKKGE